MNTVIMFLLFLGPLVIFGLVRTGARPFVPALLCVMAGGIGIGFFIWGMRNTTLAAHHTGDLLPIGLVGFLMMISAGFGAILLAVIFVARWLSGEYSEVKDNTND